MSWVLEGGTSGAQTGKEHDRKVQGQGAGCCVLPVEGRRLGKVLNEGVTCGPTLALFSPHSSYPGTGPPTHPGFSALDCQISSDPWISLSTCLLGISSGCSSTPQTHISTTDWAFPSRLYSPPVCPFSGNAFHLHPAAQAKNLGVILDLFLPFFPIL